MAILLLVVLVLAGLVVGDAIVENTSTTTITLAGQQLSGLTLGGWLLAFAVLGFVASYVLLGMLASARRSRVRRRAMRSSEREMAERVAELERENSALRDHSPDGSELPRRERAVKDDTLVEQPKYRKVGGDAAEPTGGTRRTRVAEREPASSTRAQSAVDDYPPGTDGQRDRWPDPK
jgi:hypothetical protein